MFSAFEQSKLIYLYNICYTFCRCIYAYVCYAPIIIYIYIYINYMQHIFCTTTSGKLIMLFSCTVSGAKDKKKSIEIIHSAAVLNFREAYAWILPLKFWHRFWIILSVALFLVLRWSCVCFFFRISYRLLKQ